MLRCLSSVWLTVTVCVSVCLSVRAGLLSTPVHRADSPVSSGQPQHRPPRQTPRGLRRSQQRGVEQVPERLQGGYREVNHGRVSDADKICSWFDFCIFWHLIGHLSSTTLVCFKEWFILSRGRYAVPSDAIADLSSSGLGLTRVVQFFTQTIGVFQRVSAPNNHDIHWLFRI